MSDPRIRRRVLFRGHVQGVGFRFTTASIACGLPVNGYVRNLPDGGVELVVDATDADFKMLLSELRDSFGDSIRSVDVEVVAADEEFDGFQVRH